MKFEKEVVIGMVSGLCQEDCGANYSPVLRQFLCFRIE